MNPLIRSSIATKILGGGEAVIVLEDISAFAQTETGTLIFLVGGKTVESIDRYEAWKESVRITTPARTTETLEVPNETP